MTVKLGIYACLCALTVVGAAQAQMPPAGSAVPVAVDNFIRAESDVYMSSIVKAGGLGRG